MIHTAKYLGLSLMILPFWSSIVFANYPQRLFSNSATLIAQSQPPQKAIDYYTPQVNLDVTQTPQSPQINLVTSRADFRQLDKLLAAQEWKDADEETRRVMLKIMNREEGGWLTVKNCRNFPKEELHIIDQLWLKHSHGKFGFSVQKEIWLNLGGKLDGSFDSHTYVKLEYQVGWIKGRHRLSYSDLTFNISAPECHLPWLEGLACRDDVCAGGRGDDADGVWGRVVLFSLL